MSEQPQNPPVTSARESIDDEQYSDVRTEIVSEAQALMMRLQMADEHHMPLANGMVISAGEAIVSTKLANLIFSDKDGSAHQDLASDHTGAYMQHKDGVARFRMVERDEDETIRVTSVTVDELETNFGGSSRSGAPKVVTSVEQKITNPDMVDQSFAITVTSDGLIMYHDSRVAPDEATEVRKVLSVEELPECINDFGHELLG